MLRLVSQITFIKNRGTIQVPVQLSNDFRVPSSVFSGATIDFNEFKCLYDQGNDVAFIFNWVNDVVVDESFKSQTKTAKITFPRNLDYGGIPTLMKGSNPLFGRGDRVIIKTGYEYFNEKTKQITSTLKEIFRGYIANVELGTPLVITCEDQMFALKSMRCKYPDVQDKGEKITLKNLLKRLFEIGSENNSLLEAGQDVFDFTAQPNTSTVRNSNGKIPVILPLDTAPFTYNTKTDKSIAEVLYDLKKKLYVFSYFDDFGNFHVELPFMNTQQLQRAPIPFNFEKQIIDEKGMKFQREDEISIKVIYKAESSDKKIGPFYANGRQINTDGTLGSITTKGYVGSAIGDTISMNAPDDMFLTDGKTINQDKLDEYALEIYKANVYTGFAKGSKFTTFGEPSVYLGDRVRLTSIKYPEKNGDFAVVSITRKFGINGYRQEIEIGPLLTQI